MRETFEHTADLGIRVRAAGREELFAEAARALMEVLVEDPQAEEAGLSERVRVEGDDLPDLLFDWLNELLYLFSTKRFVVREMDVEASQGSVEAKLGGWRFDPDEHRGGNEVKAITYHGLTAEERDGEWFGEVILDI